MQKSDINIIASFVASISWVSDSMSEGLSDAGFIGGTDFDLKSIISTWILGKNLWPEEQKFTKLRNRNIQNSFREIKSGIFYVKSSFM